MIFISKKACHFSLWHANSREKSMHGTCMSDILDIACFG